MANGGLRHIALKTADLKQTEKFYTAVLGLKVAFRVPPKMIFLRTPGSQDLLNFIQSDKKIAAGAGLEHFGFKVTQAQLKRLETRFKENGVAVEGRRGRNAFYISDPNGYQIEYYSD